jgi:hypothetical protein
VPTGVDPALQGLLPSVALGSVARDCLELLLEALKGRETGSRNDSHDAIVLHDVPVEWHALIGESTHELWLAGISHRPGTIARGQASAAFMSSKEPGGRTINYKVLAILLGAILLLVGMSQIKFGPQRATSVEDVEALETIWTTTDTPECRDVSRIFSVLFNEAGYLVSNQPENVKAAVVFRAKTYGVSWSEAFDQLFADTIVAGTYLSWYPLYPDLDLGDMKACTDTGILFVWSLEDALQSETSPTP